MNNDVSWRRRPLPRSVPRKSDIAKIRQLLTAAGYTGARASATCRRYRITVWPVDLAQWRMLRGDAELRMRLRAALSDGGGETELVVGAPRHCDCDGPCRAL